MQDYRRLTKIDTSALKLRFPLLYDPGLPCLPLKTSKVMADHVVFKDAQSFPFSRGEKKGFSFVGQETVKGKSTDDFKAILRVKLR